MNSEITYFFNTNNLRNQDFCFFGMMTWKGLITGWGEWLAEINLAGEIRQVVLVKGVSDPYFASMVGKENSGTKEWCHKFKMI